MKLTIRRLYSRRGPIQRVTGTVLVVVGGLLLFASAAYYAYGAVARSDLGELSYSTNRPSAMPEKASNVARDQQWTASSGDASSQAGIDASMSSPPKGDSQQGLLTVSIPPDREVKGVKSLDVQPVNTRIVGALETSVNPSLDRRPDDEAATAAGVESKAQVVAAPDVPEDHDSGAVVERREPIMPTDGELTKASSPLPSSAEANGADTPDPTHSLDIGGPEGSAGRAAGDRLAMAGEAAPASEYPMNTETSGPTQVVDRPQTNGLDDQTGVNTAATAIVDGLIGEAGPSEATANQTDLPSSNLAENPSTTEFFSLAMEAVQTQADATAQVIEASQVEASSYLLPTAVDLDGGLIAATRIRIPAIEVDSDVKELEVVSVDDGYAWETPKWLVGHVPTTAVAGGQGEGWYFGHLESPIKREGNVFLKLPEISDLLNEGEPVYIFLEAADRKFVYQAYKVDIAHKDDLRITDSGNQDITLVTCVPKYYYDHRLMVTAALVGVSES